MLFNDFRRYNNVKLKNNKLQRMEYLGVEEDNVFIRRILQIKTHTFGCPYA